MAEPPVPMRSAAVLLGELPNDATVAIATAPPVAAQAAWSSFVDGCEQRMLGEHVQRLRADWRRRFGFEPLSVDDARAAGLDDQAGMVFFGTEQAREPLLLARVGDEARFAAFVKALYADVAPPLSRPVGAASFFPAPKAATGEPPWPSYAREGPLVWLEPGGAAAAIERVLVERSANNTLGHRVDWPRAWLLASHEGALLSGYAPLHAKGPCRGLTGQLVSVRATALGLDAEGLTMGPLAAECLPAGPTALLPPAEATPIEPVYLRAFGVSLAPLLAAAPQAWRAAPAGAASAASADPSGVLQRLIGQYKERLAPLRAHWLQKGAIDGPFRLSVGGPLDAPRVSVDLLANSEAQATRAWRSFCRSPARHCRPLANGPAGRNCQTSSLGPHSSSSWQVARCQRAFVLSSTPALLPARLHALCAPRPAPLALPAEGAKRDVQPSPPLWRVSIDASLLAGSLRSALSAAGAAHPLGEWFPVHELVLAGPIGDALRDADALGGAEASVWREDGRLRWQVQQRRRARSP